MIKINISMITFLILILTKSALPQHEYLLSNDLPPVQSNLSSKIVINDTLQLDTLINIVMKNYHLAGYSASIIKKGEIYWHKNYGYARLDDSSLVSDSTLFLLLSISKLFVATAVMQLEEDGLLDLNEDINTYLPDKLTIVNPYYPNDTITTKMLLTHTSSLRDNDTVFTMISDGDYPVPLDSLLVGYFNMGGDSTNYNNWSPSDLQFDYCNMAIALLAYIVERVTDLSFEAYCQENIFRPLDMNRTSWFFSNLDSMNVAMTYNWNIIKYTSYGYVGFGPYPAAQLRTSNLQLANFLIAMMNGGVVLDSQTIEKMLTRESYYEPLDYYQGLGWFEKWIGSDDNSGYLWGYQGAGYGAVTSLFFHPDEKWGFISLCNSGTSQGNNAERIIAEELANFARNIAAIGSSITASRQAGRYQLLPNYPNPFNPSTTIEFQIPSTEFVSLMIYNILGEEVATLISKKLNPGNHTYQFDGENLASGVYYYQLVAGDYREVKKMILLR